MRGHNKESGFALILLIGITAALAIFAAVLVVMLDNQQHGTSKERASKTTLYYAEAALNSAVDSVEANTGWTTAAYTGQDSNMNSQFSTLSGAAGTKVTYRVYDNVNLSDNWDSNHDGLVWVEVTTTYPWPLAANSRTTTVRELVSSSSTISILPKAAAYSQTDTTLNNTSNIYAVNNDDTPDTSGAPYVTTIMVGGDFAANSSTTLASPNDGTHTQSLGLQVNGSVSTPGHSFSPVSGGVGLLSDYFDQSHQAALTAEARVGIPTQANSGGTSVAPSKFSPANLTTAYLTSIGATFTSGTKTYTFNNPLVISGALTLSTSGGSAFPAGTIFNFHSLYVNGSFTVTGNVTVTTTAIYVGGTFTISGASTSITDSFGPTYCTATIDWNGGSSGTVSITAGALYAKIFGVDGNGDNSGYDGSSGPTNITLGPTWIDGDAGTGDVAVNFSGPSNVASTVMCPLLATTEQTHSNGLINIGTKTSPMIYYMQCDNDGLYSNTCQWASTGEYFGLMILFEAPINITGSTSGHPNIEGAVLEGTPTSTDITMSNNASICYNQAVINACTSDSLKTTTIAPVPGTWQQLKGT